MFKDLIVSRTVICKRNISASYILECMTLSKLREKKAVENDRINDKRPMNTKVYQAG